MSEATLKEARSKATGNVAEIVKLHERICFDNSDYTIQIGRRQDGTFYYRWRYYDAAGCRDYGTMHAISEDEAREARRLGLTPWHIEGLD